MVPGGLELVGRTRSFAVGFAILERVENIVVKAIALGAILTGTVALVVGSQGSSAGALAVHEMRMGDFEIYWSWPLFIAGTVLSWGIMWLQR
ncbi:MAG: hypothetical protein AAFZ11_05030 [Pseudomonadota bacterium]